MPVAAAPDLRIPYDIDGTDVRVYSSGNIISTNTMAVLNDDTKNTYYDSGQNQPARTLCWLFPQPMTITGLWGLVESAGPVGTASITAWGWSFDTTTGLDGNWTYAGGSSAFRNVNQYNVATYGLQFTGNHEPNVRSPKVLSPPVDNVVGIRIGMVAGPVVSTRLFSAAFYGHVTTPTWLEFWHPTLDQPISVAEADWGFHDRDSVDVRPFRLKNCNVATMHGVGLAINDISADSPKAGAAHTLSLDDAIYGASITVGDLSPGEISDVLYVKRTTPSNALVGIYDLRIVPSFTGITG